MQARTMQMRNAQLEYQQHQLQLQQLNEDYQDQQKIRNLWSGSPNGDLDQLLENAKKAGVGPRTIFPLQQNILNWKKEHAALDKATLDNNASRNDLLHAIFNPAFDETDPTKQQQLFDQAKQTAVSRGIIAPEVAAGMIYPGPDGMKTLKSSFLTEKWLTADAAQQRAKAAAQTAQTGATRLTLETPGIVAGGEKKVIDLADARTKQAAQELFPMLDPKTGELPKGAAAAYGDLLLKYKDVPGLPKNPTAANMKGFLDSTLSQYEREQLAGQAAGRAQTAAHQTVMEKQGEQRLGFEGQRVGLEGKRVAQTGATTMVIPDAQGNYTVTRVTPGTTVPAGSVTPSGFSAVSVPTAQTRSMSEKAPRVLDLVNRSEDLLNANEKQLGPLKSRWDEFTAGKIGLKNQGYTQLRTNIGLLTTALMNMHVGARGGGEIMKHFADLLNLAQQDPDNLRAALGEIKNYANQVKAEGGLKGAAAPAAAPTTAPSLPASLSQSDVGKVYTNRAGKRIKILKVNPQNPKQFQSQEVQ